MANEREKVSDGPNDRPLNETIAGTGPGIADDSLAPGEDEILKAPSDQEVEEAAKRFGLECEKDTLPLEGE